MLKKYIFPQLSAVICLILGSITHLQAASVDTRNDSFYVSHYSISLDLSNLSSKSIGGHCIVSGVSRINKLDRLSLELYKLTVDSIIQDGSSLKYSYNDSIIGLPLAKTINTGDSFHVDIYYHGKPVQTSWGGFYFDAGGQYAFNLGVSLYQVPHNFGRIWFPCVDNFTDKATFSFYITTLAKHKTYCNGVIIDSVNHGNTATWHWEMTQPICTYLASVAVGNYKSVVGTYGSLNGTIPTVIGVMPADTANAKVSFQHLNAILKEYEHYYGLYPFRRVGFVGVNFGGGAMEHATNIALPNTTIEGGLNDESLWAHELSHQWWGDEVTCSTAQDMWLNEGWASYNESQYQEKLYGRKAYVDYAMTTHYNAIRYAKIVDDGDRPISPMPLEYTYGPTIYKKGADMARALRNYMGDTLFYFGLHAYMVDFAYKSASSEDFRKSLENRTKLDLQSFFNDRIYGAGWPHYEINLDSSQAEYHVAVDFRTVNSTASYAGTPLKLTWYNSQWKKNSMTVITQAAGWASANIPISEKISFIAVDQDGDAVDATTKATEIITKKGTYNLANCMMNLTVDSLKDSAMLYVVHHWISPLSTANSPKNIRLSSDRYWTVDGIFPKGFHAQALVSYDGRTFPSAYSGGFLDNDFLKGRSEDSVVLMYKPLYGGDWQLLKENTDYTKTTGSKTDEFGNIKILNLRRGQYCFGVYDAHAGVAPEILQENYMELYPNPTAGLLHVKFKQATAVKLVQVFDSQGKELKNIEPPYPASQSFDISSQGLSTGTYILQLYTDEGLCRKKFMVEK